MSHATTAHRPKKHHEEEHENHERWAVSYADMMTVLLALFIVLYAISVVDQTKFEELRKSLAIGFGSPAQVVIEGSNGAMQGLDQFQIGPDFTGLSGQSTPDDVNPATELSKDTEQYLEAVVEYQQLSDIEAQIKAEMETLGLSDKVQYKIDERGLIVGLVGTDVFFSPDDAAMTTAAQTVIDALSRPLRGQAREISVEGHADKTPSVRYATNWELSSARATAVLRRMVEQGGISAGQVSATGFGDSRPVVIGDSPEALSQNRRVDIVIQSAASEAIRALLPQIEQAVLNGSITVEGLKQQIDEANAAADAPETTTEASPSGND